MVTQAEIEGFILDKTGETLTESPIPVSGGDINEVYKIITKQNQYCIKANVSSYSAQMFRAESNGLELLRKSESFRIPEIINPSKDQINQYLLLEWIEQGSPDRNFWETFGKHLGKLHQTTNDHFGLDHDNFIATLHQSNRKHSKWSSFYAEERILPLFREAFDSSLFSKRESQMMDYLCNQLESLLPDEPPALLHGDLWSGNYLCDQKSQPVLIDPAVYFGNREADIAMTLLFGGFPTQMYDAYNEAFPLKSGWQERIELHQLYPLLVHVNLFRGHYIDRVKSVISRYQ